MKIMSDPKLKNDESGKYTKISLFIQNELRKGITINMCNISEYKVEQFPDNYKNPTYQVKLENKLHSVGKFEYKYSNKFLRSQWFQN